MMQCSGGLDLKVKLDYLRHDQAWELFKACLTKVEPVPPEMAGIWKAKLDSIENLTVGDFSVVKRRLNLMDIDLEPEILLDELAREIYLLSQSILICILSIFT
jgi:hypothetical protein